MNNNPSSPRYSGLKYRETSDSSRPRIQRKSTPSSPVLLVHRKKRTLYSNPITITLILFTSLCYINIFLILVTSKHNPSSSISNNSFVLKQQHQSKIIPRKVYPRIVSNDNFQVKTSRSIEHIPGHHHKSDEKGLDPHIDQSMCIPMEAWQVLSRPTCNTIHEIDLPNENLIKIGSGGWRIAWKYNLKNDHVVLKTLKYDSPFGKQTQYRHLKDAIITSHLTSSPHIINIYAFCAQSTINEYASTSLQDFIRDKNRASPEFLTSKQKLLYTRDLALGLRDLHDTSLSVHKDLKPSNVVLLNEKLKLNDFNDSDLLFWNITSENVCYFRRRRWTPNFHSPEEIWEKPLTHKIDIYVLGSMIYYILVGYQPYNDLKKVTVYSRISRGILAVWPDEYEQSEDVFVRKMMELRDKCQMYDPSKRPEAREVVEEVDEFLMKNA